MSNLDVRKYAKEKGVKIWEIAEGLGLSESWFFRKIRKEFPDKEKEKIFGIIDRLAEQKKA